MTDKRTPQIGRRTLLGSGGLALSLAGTTLFGASATALAAPPPRRKGHQLNLGLASYSMRKQSIDQVIAFCKENNVETVSLKSMHMPKEQPGLKDALAKFTAANLRILGGGDIRFENNADQVKSEFEYAKAAGFPVIVANPHPDSLDLVEKAVKEYDIKIAIHNHGPEDEFYPSPTDVLKHVKKRDKRMGSCMDIGHTVRAGADPIRMVSVLGARLLDLHIKDLTDLKDKDSQVEVGKGNIDVAGLIKTLIKRRFAGQVSVEYEINPDDPRVGLKESLAYLRGVVSGLSA